MHSTLEVEKPNIISVPLFESVSWSSVNTGVTVVVVAFCLGTFQYFVVVAAASVGNLSPDVGSCAVPPHTRRQLSIVKNLLALPLQPPYVNWRQSSVVMS
jgi:hypothetical protein